MNTRHRNWYSLILANLVLWAMYFMVGRLGLLLALPPAYAAPIFLPAGIALASVVVGGMALLPAVWLGSLSINLVYPLLSPEGISATTLHAASAAALGALLQAWIGSVLVRRYIDPALAAGRDVVRFILLAGGITLISSTVSVGGMVLVGMISASNGASDWLAWWMGDTIGILLAAPLCWIVIGRPRALWSRRRLIVGLPLLLSTAAFIAIYLQADRWENIQQLQTFRLKAQQTGDLLQEQFSEHERFIYAIGKALSEPRPSFDADHFSTLAHGYLDQRPELLSMAWLTPIKDGQRAEFEQWGRRHISPDFEIRQRTAFRPAHHHSTAGNYPGQRHGGPVAAANHLSASSVAPAQRRPADRHAVSGHARSSLEACRVPPFSGALRRSRRGRPRPCGARHPAAHRAGWRLPAPAAFRRPHLPADAGAHAGLSATAARLAELDGADLRAVAVGPAWHTDAAH
ncbi:MAG: MASE1 domain-containing protein [Rhodospirillaceae bacterium]|nr:MASE1 domain-containing protein [Rhodospirillaceae bacterium]